MRSVLVMTMKIVTDKTSFSRNWKKNVLYKLRKIMSFSEKIIASTQRNNATAQPNDRHISICRAVRGVQRSEKIRRVNISIYGVHSIN